VLEDGKVSGEGSFDELYENHAYVRELVSRQMIGETPQELSL
jgi:ABC-type multidrug transport system fused ATPase/permease subunit